MIHCPIYQFLGICLLSRLISNPLYVTAHLIVQVDTFDKFSTSVFVVVGW
jgi:hypothetical protein